jgi:hypothetical protein
MIEISPEMVAVVFNQGFQFKLPAVMEDLVSRESDELPEWDSLADVVVLKPWANELAKEMLKEPMGEWLLTVAAGLEYLYAKPGKPWPPPVMTTTTVKTKTVTAMDDDDRDQDQSDDPQRSDDDGRTMPTPPPRRSRARLDGSARL